MTTTDTIRALEVGQRVRFYGDARWWDVQAGDDRFTILTRQAAFKPKGEVAYTIIDRVRALRGPCNLIGQGWDFDAGLRASSEELLRALVLDAARKEWFEENKHTLPTGGFRWPEHLDPVDDDGIPAQAVEVSYRNNVPVRIDRVDTPLGDARPRTLCRTCGRAIAVTFNKRTGDAYVRTHAQSPKVQCAGSRATIRAREVADRTFMRAR